MRLAEQNRRLAFWAVRRVRSRDRDDVAQAALLGLCEAAIAHDPARGAFASLAVILCRRRAFEELRRQRRHEGAEVPLFFVAPDGHEEEREELPPVQAPDVETPLLVARLREALDELPDREARVLRLRYGLDGEERTLRAVGLALGVSSARAGQLERVALRRLRRALKARPGGR